jgi:hypothetical protein
MKQIDNNVALAEADDTRINVPIDPIGSLAGPSAIGASLAALRLIEALDPKFFHHRIFKAIPGGLRIPESGTDLIVSAIDAGLAPDFDMRDLRKLVHITQRTTIVLRDAPAGARFAIVTASPLAALEMSSGLLWSDIFDPALRIVSCRPSDALPWLGLTCVRMVPGKLPLIGPPPCVGGVWQEDGFQQAAEILNQWRVAVQGGGF